MYIALYRLRDFANVVPFYSSRTRSGLAPNRVSRSLLFVIGLFRFLLAGDKSGPAAFAGASFASTALRTSAAYFLACATYAPSGLRTMSWLQGDPAGLHPAYSAHLRVCLLWRSSIWRSTSPLQRPFDIAQRGLPRRL